MIKGFAGLKQPLWQRSPSAPRSLRVSVVGISVAVLATIAHWMTVGVHAQTNNGGSITLRSDIQEANAVTGVITARGNVQIDYPEQQIYATSSQAQFFNQERRIILSGNVVVLQEGNRLEAETVTYLIDEGRFVALPQPNEQVQTTYILPASEEPASEPSPQATPIDVNAPPPESLEPDATLEISPLDAATSTNP